MTIRNIFATLLFVAASTTGVNAAEASKPAKDTGAVETTLFRQKDLSLVFNLADNS